MKLSNGDLRWMKKQGIRTPLDVAFGTHLDTCICIHVSYAPSPSLPAQRFPPPLLPGFCNSYLFLSLALSLSLIFLLALIQSVADLIISQNYQWGMSMGSKIRLDTTSTRSPRRIRVAAGHTYRHWIQWGIPRPRALGGLNLLFSLLLRYSQSISPIGFLLFLVFYLGFHLNCSFA